MQIVLQTEIPFFGASALTPRTHLLTCGELILFSKFSFEVVLFMNNFSRFGLPMPISNLERWGAGLIPCFVIVVILYDPSS